MNVISYYMPPHVIMCETQNNLFQLISNFGFIELDKLVKGDIKVVLIWYILKVLVVFIRERIVLFGQ